MKVCYFGAYQDLYPRNNVIREGLRRNGVEVYECHDNTRGTWRRYPRLLVKVLRLPKNFDVIMVPEFGQTNVLLAKILSFLLRKKLIFDSFASFYEAAVIDRQLWKKRSLQSRWLHFLDKQALSLADYVLYQTEEQAEDYTGEFRVKKQKSRVLYLGNDDSLFYPRKIQRKDNHFRILFSGSYSRQTGLECVLDAAKCLREEKDIKFHFMGSNAPEVRHLWNKQNLTNATFEGWIKQEEVPFRIAESDILLGIFGDTPKGNNVISNRVVQAMAMRKPLITGKTRTIGRILRDRQHAILCPLCDSEAIAEAILLLRKDENLRNRIAENGYRFYKENFSPDVIGKQLKGILEEIVRGGTSR